MSITWLSFTSHRWNMSMQYLCCIVCQLYLPMSLHAWVRINCGCADALVTASASVQQWTHTHYSVATCNCLYMILHWYAHAMYHVCCIVVLWHELQKDAPFKLSTCDTWWVSIKTFIMGCIFQLTSLWWCNDWNTATCMKTNQLKTVSCLIAPYVTCCMH